MRLNLFLQQAGVGSRREAERLVAAGVVGINGVPALPTQPVNDGDVVTVHGLPVARSTAPLPRLFKLHKPLDVLVTASDPQGRATIYDLPSLQAPNLPRLMPVGRLDVNSEGLLLLSSDGPLAQRLMSPATALPRVYQVRVYGQLTPAQTAKMQKGLVVDGVRYRGAPVQAMPRAPGATGKNVWYELVLTEGKNREVRKMFAHFGLVVNRLLRTRYGPFTLDDLPAGQLVEVPASGVQSLLASLPPVPAKPKA